MGRFLLKAAFGSEVLIRGQRGAYLRADAYSKTSYVNVAYKVLKTDIIASRKVF